MKMRVTKARGLRYAKRNYKQGEVVDVKDNHAPILTAGKIAKVVDETTKAENPAPRQPAKDKTPAGQGNKKAPVKRRTYKRRDMKAEE